VATYFRVGWVLAAAEKMEWNGEERRCFWEVFVIHTTPLVHPPSI